MVLKIYFQYLETYSNAILNNNYVFLIPYPCLLCWHDTDSSVLSHITSVFKWQSLQEPGLETAVRHPPRLFMKDAGIPNGDRRLSQRVGEESQGLGTWLPWLTLQALGFCIHSHLILLHPHYMDVRVLQKSCGKMELKDETIWMQKTF